MAEEPSNPAPLGEIEHGPSKFEQFLDKNQKKLIIGILVLIAAVSAMIVIRGMQETEDHSAGEALSAASESGSESYDLAALRDVIDSFPTSPASGSAALLLANEQWKDNRRDESIETLRDFLTKEPNHAGVPSAQIALGLHLLEQDKAGEATTVLQELIDGPTGAHLAPFALITLGDLAKKSGDNDAAKARYQQARDNYPDNSPSMLQFANQRIALLGVDPPVKIDPPAVPEPTPTPTPSPTPVGPPGLFPELSNPAPGVPGIPAPGVPGVPTPPAPNGDTTPAPPTEPPEPTPPAGDDSAPAGTDEPVSDTPEPE